MSNLPPNPFNNVSGAPPVNANPAAPLFNHSQQFGQVPSSQLPPGYSGLKQDANSNSPVHTPMTASHNSAIQNVNHFNQSSNSSPAFNQPGIIPPTTQNVLHSSPMKIPPSMLPPQTTVAPNPPLSSANLRPTNANPPVSHFGNFPPQQRQINNIAPPLVPSSQFNQPIVNGPPSLGPSIPSGPPTNMQQYQPPGPYTAPQMLNKMPFTTAPTPLMNPGFAPPSISKPMAPGTVTSQPNIPFSSSLTGPPRNSPLMQGPPLTGPPTSAPLMSGPVTNQPLTNGPLIGPPRPMGINGPGQMGPPTSGVALSGLPGPSMTSAPLGPPISGPNLGPPRGPTLPPSSQNGPINQPLLSGPPRNGASGPMAPTAVSGPMGPPGLSGPMGPPGLSGPPGQNLPPHFAPAQQPIGPPMNQQAPQMQQGPPKSNMQGRYPQMPQSGYNQPASQPMPPMGTQQQYNTQAITQQMGQMSVTKQGFDQLWGHHMVDLLQCRQVLPEYPEDPPEIKLGHQFADSPNCSPEIFRCTINRIPETNSLLQKSRLPLGILIHPFKDINHLPVIQCNTIVRCRACRTYINPFVYFVDAKRWKCNLCYRVNDLPDEFQYDPVSKSYGDPSRRPEIKSATIEFIAPGEYMLRPPQPAVYLFLMDVSQIARDSGYLQVVCDTLKASLDQLPGDARTQIGFICYDLHVHYYLMAEGLTRPKEMTVLDIDDIFVPSPESLLVNLGERKELVRELLTVLPQRHSGLGAPASALGAALQAAYKLMAPTGGRITVFQTCLPNIGPGALQSREDPNARSSKDVAHLNPATDFYKRLALDCCGAQVAIDMFLLNSQYSDLATLSGMSKFSGGSVHHIPLFKASRRHLAAQLDRALTRYLTRKIGFEAVMRVRCTRGIAIHTFHGNFFVRSTDLLSLPNVSPDAGFGMQLTIEEPLSDLSQVCFQAALLYTSSKGERRIRVHTLALPIANTLPDVLHAADQQCIIGLLSKMAVDRALSASLSEAREALMHVAVEALSAHRLAHNLPAAGGALLAPASLRLLPLYLAATLKRKAFRTGTSTRLDDRVFDMCTVKSAPLSALLQGTYPALYAVHDLAHHTVNTDSGETVADPPHLHLSAEKVNSTGAYLLDDGESMILYVCCNVSPAFLSETFGIAAFSQLTDEMRELPKLDTPGNQLLHSFIERLNDERPYPSDLLILRDNSPSRLLFTERLVDDRVESAFSYYEFLQHVKSQVK